MVPERSGIMPLEKALSDRGLRACCELLIQTIDEGEDIALAENMLRHVLQVRASTLLLDKLAALPSRRTAP